MGNCTSEEDKKKQVQKEMAKIGFIDNKKVTPMKCEITKWRAQLTDYVVEVYKENKVDNHHIHTRLVDAIVDGKKDDPNEPNLTNQILNGNYSHEEQLEKVDEIIAICDIWLAQIEEESNFYDKERDEKKITVNHHKTIDDVIVIAKANITEQKRSLNETRVLMIGNNERKIEAQKMRDEKKAANDAKDAKVKLSLGELKLTMETEDERKFVMMMNTFFKYSSSPEQFKFKDERNVNLKTELLKVGKDYNIDVDTLIQYAAAKGNEFKDIKNNQNYDGSKFDNVVKAHVLKFKIDMYKQFIEIYKAKAVDGKYLEDAVIIFEKEYETLAPYHDTSAITDNYSNDERFIFMMACAIQESESVKKGEIEDNNAAYSDCRELWKSSQEIVLKDMNALFEKIKQFEK